MKTGHKFSWIALCILSVAGAAYANGFRNPPEGARALGRAGGKVAQIDDASAVAINPANLTDLQKPGYLVSLTLVDTKTEFDSASAGSADTDDPFKFLPNIFATMPVGKDGCSVGIGISTPFGQSTKWEDNSPFPYSVPYFVELRLINLNPTIATKINDKLSIGAGVDIYLSDLTFKQRIPWSSIVSAPVPDGRAKLSGEGAGIGGNVGITYEIAKGHRVALTYRSPVKVDYEGDFKASEVPGPGIVEPKSDFDTDITFPTTVALGYGMQVTSNLQVGVDVEWIEFSKFDDLPMDLGANNSAGLFPPSIPEQWDDVWTFGLGADLKVAEHCSVRAGWVYLESPIPEKTFSPTLPDADRHVFSIGSGYEKDGFSIDLAYAISIYDRTIDENPNPEALGDYDTVTHLLAVSVGQTF